MGRSGEYGQIAGMPSRRSDRGAGRVDSVQRGRIVIVVRHERIGRGCSGQTGRECDLTRILSRAVGLGQMINISKQPDDGKRAARGIGGVHRVRRTRFDGRSGRDVDEALPRPHETIRIGQIGKPIAFHRTQRYPKNLAGVIKADRRRGRIDVCRRRSDIVERIRRRAGSTGALPQVDLRTPGRKK